jgi:hypothetical protein
MECIYCKTDNSLEDRIANQGRCSKCNHLFAFEPNHRGSITMTDAMFARAIANLSVNDRFYFTPKQFFYFLDQELRAKTSYSKIAWLILYFVISSVATAIFGSALFQVFQNIIVLFIPIIFISIIFMIVFFSVSQSSKVNHRERKLGTEMLQILGGVIFVLGIAESFVIHSWLLLIVSVFLGLLAFGLGIWQRQKLINQFQTFLFQENQLQKWLDRWQAVHYPLHQLLSIDEEHSDWLGDSLDRFNSIIVCDSSRIAQMLIANYFHLSHQCAIVSVTGYPQSTFQAIQRSQFHSHLKVYALHDCSPKGIGLVHHLKTSPNWFQNRKVSIFDIGLLPRQASILTNAFIQSSFESAQAAKQLPLEVRQELSKAELNWLESGRLVELESFTPKRLLQIINRSISGSQDLVSDSGTFIQIK